ncbi:unnamed protein product [Diabrotica balteata]|uniref:RAE1/2 domain-containing protein n=1 Tax=Diabrotica balteata TaxID=107213 RepID=A0A9N9T396_DIABA|nr:unnamed protein product [Diabrotica balteata]
MQKKWIQIIDCIIQILQLINDAAQCQSVPVTVTTTIIQKVSDAHYIAVFQRLRRCALITDKSILDSEKEHLTLAFYPPENGKPLVKIIELGCLTGTCPKPLNVVHLLAKQGTTPQEDFSSVINSLFEQNEETNMENKQKPSMLWSMYFSLPDTNNADLTEGFPDNVFVCSGPDTDLDYDYSVKKAEEMFRQIYPDLDFLPRAPDPEEIVIGE